MRACVFVGMELQIPEFLMILLFIWSNHARTGLIVFTNEVLMPSEFILLTLCGGFSTGSIPGTIEEYRFSGVCPCCPCRCPPAIPYSSRVPASQGQRGQ
tara:strand:- start:127 stop:423 length:297 start_codon:yes stop_codon:yes gene_type:complete